MKEDCGFSGHRLGGVEVAVAIGKGTPGSRNSNIETWRTGSQPEVGHEGLCQSCLGVEHSFVDVIKDLLGGFKSGDTSDLHFRKAAVSTHSFTVKSKTRPGNQLGDCWSHPGET